jgi:arginyl-tRNA synthetase
MKSYLASCVRQELEAMGDLPPDFDITFETPNNPEHGDLATNAALTLARVFRRAPRAIADELVERLRALPIDPDRIAAVEVAGPGFINFRFSEGYLHTQLADVLAEGDTFGRRTTHAGRTAIVEYVSANPTGPLTVGHGRNAVLGDTVANLLEWVGYDVTREYYFNDAGRQMRVLGESVRARYLAVVHPDLPLKTLEAGVEVPEVFPEDGYLGRVHHRHRTLARRVAR